MIHEIKDVKIALGTFITITVVHPDIKTGKSAIQLALAEINRVQNLMSVYNIKSEVSLLNQNGHCDGLSKDTQYVLQKSKYYFELCEGAFDATILPLVELWEEKSRQRLLPTETEIAEKLELVGSQNLVIEDNRVWFTKKGMKITLAGAAKGYAVDRAIATLINCNITHALVNAGGDIRCIGGKTETEPWKVAIRNPLDKKRVSTMLALRDRAIATSGSYQRPYNDMIDPRSGRPVVHEIVSASVLADTATDADILTKCLYVRTIKDSREIWRNLTGVEGIAITRDGNIIKLP
jgi:FAD:protein FMN transferase